MECVVREFREETGLGVEVTSLLDVASDVTDMPGRTERLHTLRILYSVRVVGGDLTHEPDETTDGAAWHRLDDALSLELMPFVRDLLADR